MPGLLSQINAFILTLLLGLFAGAIFHYYQLVIRRAKVGKYILYMVDLILWIIMLLMVFGALVIINQAEMRLYILLAWLGGILLYYRYLSSHLTAVLSSVAEQSIYTSARLVKGIKWPFAWLAVRGRAYINKYQTKPPDNGAE